MGSFGYLQCELASLFWQCPRVLSYLQLCLGLVFLIMMFDPIRYTSFIWAGISEQVLGIAYGFYIYSALGQLTTTQLIIQAVVNAALIVGMYMLWSGLRKSLTP